VSKVALERLELPDLSGIEVMVGLVLLALLAIARRRRDVSGCHTR
jgi:MYXO-CTERM domain-containing protein